MSTIAVNAITDANGGNTTSINNTTPNAYNTVGKNLLINGAMEIAQRGTTSASTGYQTVDRWRLNLGTQQEQKTDAPDQFKNSMEITGTVAGSSGYGIVLQRIESNNIYSALGQNCTLSCYVKNTGTSTANVSVEIYRANSTDNFSGLTLVSSLTSQAITSGWTRITFPAFSVPTSASTGLEVRIFRYDGSNDQEWLITGVQLEVGSVATEFERRPYTTELSLCQRYYWRQYFSGANVIYDRVYWNGAGNNAIFNFPAPAGMRINAATVTCSPTTNGTGVTFTYHPHGNIIVYRVSASGDNYLYAQDLSINAEL